MSETIIGPCDDPDFLGTPEDERLGGEIYNNLPNFPFENQVNRKRAVHVIAEAIRRERENVKQYGRHLDGCPRLMWPKTQVLEADSYIPNGKKIGDPVVDCTCGFEDACK